MTMLEGKVVYKPLSIALASKALNSLLWSDIKWEPVPFYWPSNGKVIFLF